MTIWNTPLDGLRVWAITGVSAAWAAVVAMIDDIPHVDRWAEIGAAGIFFALFVVSVGAVVKLLNMRETMWRDRIRDRDTRIQGLEETLRRLRKE